MIAGIGVDLCDIDRLRRALYGRTGERLRARVFTADEQAYCERRGRARFQSYAARFAAKEAVMKVLGTGWGAGVGWRDVEVASVEEGPPGLRLHGEAARVARRRRMRRWHLSLSHTDTCAVAMVVAEGP